MLSSLSIETTELHYRQSRQKQIQLVHNGYVYCKDTQRGGKVYWRCRQFRKGVCSARIITVNEKIASQPKDHTHDPEEYKKDDGDFDDETNARMSS